MTRSLALLRLFPQQYRGTDFGVSAQSPLTALLRSSCPAVESVTTTSVGYGDYTPVTQVGRGIAILVIIVGIGLIGRVSATVAAWFVRRLAEGVSVDD